MFYMIYIFSFHDAIYAEAPSSVTCLHYNKLLLFYKISMLFQTKHNRIDSLIQVWYVSMELNSYFLLSSKSSVLDSFGLHPLKNLKVELLIISSILQHLHYSKQRSQFLFFFIFSISFLVPPICIA